MRNKQTAVEWLLDKINDVYFEFQFEKEINEAKEMEKQQIISALKAGVNFEINCNIDSNTNLTYYEYFIKYYNKTFNK